MKYYLFSPSQHSSEEKRSSGPLDLSLSNSLFPDTELIEDAVNTLPGGCSYHLPKVRENNFEAESREVPFSLVTLQIILRHC
jgi:hypothetical protein